MFILLGNPPEDVFLRGYLVDGGVFSQLWETPGEDHSIPFVFEAFSYQINIVAFVVSNHETEQLSSELVR